MSAPIRLACGHQAERKEFLRHGSEKWCHLCANWQYQLEDLK